MPDVTELTDAILVDEAVLTSGERDAVLSAVNEFAHWALTEAMLVKGEFPIGAVFAANTSFYAGQVENGGHWQFAGNSRMSPDMLDRIVNALHLAGADAYRDIFAEFVTIMTADSGLMTAALNSDYTRLPESIKSLDQRFFALGADDLMGKMETWVRSLPSFRPLPAAALAAEKAAIMARNKNFATRKAAAQAAREEAEDGDPKFVAARRLCKQAGLKFLGFNPGKYLDGPNKIRWGMRTDKGVYYLTIGPEGAELRSSAMNKLRAPDWQSWRRAIACLVLIIGSIAWALHPAHPIGAVFGFAATLFFTACGIFNIRKLIRGRESLFLNKSQLSGR